MRRQQISERNYRARRTVPGPESRRPRRGNKPQRHGGVAALCRSLQHRHGCGRLGKRRRCDQRLVAAFNGPDCFSAVHGNPQGFLRVSDLVNRGCPYRKPNAGKGHPECENLEQRSHEQDKFRCSRAHSSPERSLSRRSRRVSGKCDRSGESNAIRLRAVPWDGGVPRPTHDAPVPCLVTAIRTWRGGSPGWRGRHVGRTSRKRVSCA